MRSYRGFGKLLEIQMILAADDPIGAVPDLQPVSLDFERKRRQQQRRQDTHPAPPV